MKGTATFIGGPLDEQIRELPDLVPVYLCPVKDRVYTLEVQDMVLNNTYGILEYRRTRVRYEPATKRWWAVYTLDL
jgi:hypothetical protein